MQRPPQASIALVRKSTPDVDRLKQYFAGIESLAREARVSQDPRVIREAAMIIGMQAETARELLRRF